jgi:hypothetical protein
MPNISLGSFLKILSFGSPEKAREYGKYLTPGGYDFYWQLKDAAFDMTVGRKPFEECIKPINGIKNTVERKHNLDGLVALQKWMSGRELSFFNPPKSTCSSPKGYLTIKLEPEFGVVDKGNRQLVQIWNTKSVELKPIIAGVGIYLMQKHLLSGEFADCACVILDLRKGRPFITDRLPAQIPMMVSSEFAWVDNFFEQFAKAA